MTSRPTLLRTLRRRYGPLAALVVSYAAAVAAVPFASSGAWADQAPPGFVVIVNPQNPSSRVTQDFLAQVFFKRTTRWSHGVAIQPVDQPLQSSVRRAFSTEVLKRSAPAVRGYWLQRIFSGRDVPPPQLDSDAEVVRYVQSSPGGVGYVSSGSPHGAVKTLTVAQ